jgi:hypothetical protein
MGLNEGVLGEHDKELRGDLSLTSARHQITPSLSRCTPGKRRGPADPSHSPMAPVRASPYLGPSPGLVCREQVEQVVSLKGLQRVCQCGLLQPFEQRWVPAAEDRGRPCNEAELCGGGLMQQAPGGGGRGRGGRWGGGRGEGGSEGGGACSMGEQQICQWLSGLGACCAQRDCLRDAPEAVGHLAGLELSEVVVR